MFGRRLGDQRRPRATPVAPGVDEGVDMSLWDVLVSIFWFMILFAWIRLLITIFADLFRDHELSGWGKALWTVFLIVLPWIGVLVYLIARGRSMNERAQLADLRDRGTISDEEFQHAKAKVLGKEAKPAAGAQADQRPVPSPT